jgi:hypothetical protein
MKYHTIYFDAENQKIRFTQSAPENLAVTYEYVGKSQRVLNLICLLSYFGINTRTAKFRWIS